MNYLIMTTAFNLLLATNANPPATSPAISDSDRLSQAEAQAFREAADHIAPCVVTIETVGGTAPTETTRRGPRTLRAAPGRSLSSLEGRALIVTYGGESRSSAPIMRIYRDLGFGSPKTCGHRPAAAPRAGR